MIDSETFGNRRFNLDGPPPSPSARTAPATPEALYDSSSGTVTKNDEAMATGDPGVQDTAIVFSMLAELESLLGNLAAILPEITPICSDTITVLRQAVPQALANKQAGSPMSNTGASSTVNQLAGLFGGGGGQGQQSQPPPIAGPSPLSAPPGAGGVMG